MGHSLLRVWALMLQAHVYLSNINEIKTGLSWNMIYHLVAIKQCELWEKSWQLLFMWGLTFWRGSVLHHPAAFCQLGPIRGSAVGFSSNERRPGKSTSVQRQCEAGFNDIEQRQCAGALASSPVTWSYRRWSGSNQGSSTKLYDIFYFQSDVDFTGMASHTHGFPG